jgi:nucleoid DNA-binding protein
MEKFWTDAKIAETLSKERVLKPMSERRPKTFLTTHSLSKLVSERNGFVYDNVKEVLDDMAEIMWDQILMGNRIYFPKIGSLYLSIKPPYRTNINLKGLGGVLKEHFVAPRYEVKFYRNEGSLFFLKQGEVTEEHLDKIYYSKEEIKSKEKATELVVNSTKEAERKM